MLILMKRDTQSGRYRVFNQFTSKLYWHVIKNTYGMKMLKVISASKSSDNKVKLKKC